MKKTNLFIILFLAFKIVNAQSDKVSFTEKNFEMEFLSYNPIQRTNVSSKNYKWSIEVLSETKKSLLENGNKYFGAHYWNILTAFDFLKEDTDLLKLVFVKLANSKGGCEYITSYKDMVKFDDKIPELYNQYYKSCNSEQKGNKNLDIDEYITDNKLNNDLVKLINIINIDDQKYRGSDEQTYNTRQPELDKQNQKLIDSLFSEHKKYIGISLVGEKFESVMWSVIQHSNLEMMEKYLPIIQKAVQDKELNKTPFKMLIDRIYSQKHDYQIFGSQIGVKNADEKTRNEIIKRYGIE
ncbi:hypothetical protein CLV33_104124 [Jejuia pallidilutea]|jgi:hypothetical protein|uniref:Uncharacterized protein n=1 Tax=Jejuia pallidilutea TaxID=504487 RepID=A0A362X0K1_9FLAO|nr:DUF6624 domain-containing protein [Jejuia pallidilutea]PQV48918.1 hypothetical protein CLV33_104124 [Jejuia pallidilutea]